MTATYHVSTDALNLRVAPALDAPVLGALVENESITAEAVPPVVLADGSMWLSITSASGLAGWINVGFVTAIKPPPGAKYRVSTDALNLRAGPGIGHAILELLHDGDALTESGAAVRDSDGDLWRNVTVPSGATGWVSAAFVTLETLGHGMPTDSLAWGARVSPEFCTRVREVATNVGCEPDFLMAVMAFETGRAFTSSVRNQLSGATGLIQFMPSTAVGLGTTVEALAAMTDVDQLAFVERYLQPHRGRLRTVEDLYMAILWPVAVGEPNDFALFRAGTIQYTQNAGLDSNGDGIITKREAAAKVLEQLAEGRRRENCR